MARNQQIDYPQVPQSHQLNEQSTAQYGNRFSWMKTSRDVGRQQHAQDVQNYDHPSTRHESNTTIPAQIPDAPTQQDSMQKQHEAQMTQEAYNASVSQRPPQEGSQHTHPQLPALSSDIKRSEKSMPETPIAPDANPLSPSFPNPTTKQERRNTNMGILAPPPNTDFSANAYEPVAQPVRGGTWQHGLGSCADPSTCLTGIFCPCILYGRVQHRLLLRSDHKDGTNMLGYKRVNGSCVAWTILCGINGVLSGIQRSRVRRTYEMAQGSGNCFGDCLLGCCCCCCVLAQSEKEMKHREEGGRRAGISQQEGYVPPGGMTFSRQI